MELTLRSLPTADGRNLEYGTIGNPEGKTVVFHHGTPGLSLIHISEPTRPY